VQSAAFAAISVSRAVVPDQLVTPQQFLRTYPREENDRILAWFDPSLALAS
jgi:hypothetical protein